MLDRGAGDHRIKEQRAGHKIDHGCAGDTERTDVATWQTGSNGGANKSLPNHCASVRVERIYAIGFSCDDDHRRAAGPVLNVERLSIHASRNCAVELQVPPQI